MKKDSVDQKIVEKAKEVFPKFRWLDVTIRDGFEPESYPFSVLDCLCYSRLRERENNRLELLISDDYATVRYPKDSIKSLSDIINLVLDDKIWEELYLHFNPDNVKITY